MMKLTSFLCLLSTAFAPVGVQSAASLSNVVSCNTVEDKDGTFDVCGVGQFTSPSPSSIGNETTYIGGYTFLYDLTPGLENGTEVTEEQRMTDIQIYVVRDDDDNCNVTVTIGGVATDCAFCSYCEADKYTADCLTVENGRFPNCEEASPDVIFFPLTAAAINATSTPVPQNDTTTEGDKTDKDDDKIPPVATNTSKPKSGSLMADSHLWLGSLVSGSIMAVMAAL